MFLPKVSMIACTDLNSNYCYKDQDGVFKNIVDAPVVSDGVRELDRVIFRTFLSDFSQNIAVCGPQVEQDLGSLTKSFMLKLSTTESIDDVYKEAMKGRYNIAILGGHRLYRKWIESGLVDEIYNHQLRFFMEHGVETKRAIPIDPDYAGTFGENYRKTTIGYFDSSNLIKWVKR